MSTAIEIPFRIRIAEAENRLRQLQALTGENLTETVRKTLAERLERERLKIQPGAAGLRLVP